MQFIGIFHVVPNPHDVRSSVENNSRYNCISPYNESQGEPKQHWIPLAFIVWTKKKPHYIIFGVPLK